MISLRARFARRREDGFALIFVILLTTAIMAVVATTLSVTTPNIVNAKHDQDSAAALAAAQSGVDDVIAYLSNISACRSTTKICSQALGANSATLSRPSLGNGQSFHWTTDSSLTPEEYVRVHSTGTANGVSKSLTADISLAPSILSFGYYTDYESQSPTYLADQYSPRTIDLEDSGTYANVNALNTSGGRITVTTPTTVRWAGPNGTGDPDPVGICGQHWYYDSAASPGRYQNVDSHTGQSIWGENGTIVTGTKTNNVLRTSTCDVVFTTGMTMDGPIYTRDALYIYDGSSRTGPVFNAPVYTLWGFGSDTTPTPPAGKPWRADISAGGNVDPTSAYSPKVAGLDLQLPTTIGTDGLPDNYCLYYGPTRVVLNGDGTATVTSPGTKTKNSASDSSCYPSGSISSGIVNYTLDYADVGDATIYVKELGTKPTAGWPDNPTKSTNTASSSNEVMWIPATSGGATSPDATTVTAPSSGCSSSNGYSATPGAPCAWTDVTSASESGGWARYSNTSTCSTSLASSDERDFECDYSGTASGRTPTTKYSDFRTLVQTALATNNPGGYGSCQTGDLTSCLTNYFTKLLKGANSGDRAINASGASVGDHQYLVSLSKGTVTQSTTQSVGGVPTSAVSGDSLFTSDGTPAQEKATRTPYTLTVSQQVYNCYSKTSPYAVLASTKCTQSSPTGTFGWGDGSNGNGKSVPQFVTTVTQSVWSITQAASGESYFPNTDDVTDYSTGTNAAGAAVGSTGTNQPGDLYVEGANSGKLSLIAQDDVIVTGDITNPSDSSYNDVYNPNTDAVDIVAGTNVRNYHPVQCVDQTAAHINATSAGWCPNDITGLYSGGMSSSSTANPARQYTNINGTGARVIDAALFAMSGSFATDGYNRGVPLGNLTVNGGIYQSHRGANGVTGSTSGYSLQYHYIDLEHANLPYAPPATGGSTSRVWNVVSLSAGGS